MGKVYEKVTLLLNWTPNTYFLGAYVARSKGFFKEEGLEVDLTMYKGKDSIISLVGNGEVEFAYSYQYGKFLTLAPAGKHSNPIVTIATVLQHNTTGFAGLRSAGIQSAKDFANKRYSSFGINNKSERVFRLEKATLDDVMSAFGGNAKEIIHVDGKYGNIAEDAQTFCQGTQKNLFDFAWIFEGWEGIEAQLKNLDLFYIPLVEIHPAFDYYLPTIISSEKYLSENRDTTMRFIRALKKGYEWSVENPEESALILYEAEPSLDKNLVLKSAQFLAQKFIDDAPMWGIMKQEPWDDYTKWLQEKELIEGSYSVEGAFTNEFVNQG